MAKRKRTTRKKNSSRYTPELQSFRIVKDTIPFTTIRFTKQTFYWIIILAFIVILQLWIVKLQTDLGNLTEALNSVKIDQ